MKRTILALVLGVALAGMMADFAHAGPGPAAWLSVDINGSLPAGNLAAGPERVAVR